MATNAGYRPDDYCTDLAGLAPARREMIKRALAALLLLAALPVAVPIAARAGVERVGGWGRGDGAVCNEIAIEAYGLAAASGQLYAADEGGNELRRLSPILSPDCRAERVAGTSRPGFAGDGAPATLARLQIPLDVAIAPSGILYITDSANERLRAVLPTGTIVTVAGVDYLKPFGQLVGVDVGPDGWVYVADADANVNRVWRVQPWPCNGACAVTPFVGTGTLGFGGDNGPREEAILRQPRDVKWHNGHLFIADTGNQRIREVDSAGIIRTVVGSGGGFAGDGGPATQARLDTPTQIEFGSDESLYISDTNNNRVRRRRPDGIIETVLGSGADNPTFTFSTDPLALAITRPLGLAVVPVVGGDVVFVSSADDQIIYALRRDMATPTVTRVATVTHTPSRTASATATRSASLTPLPSSTATRTATATRTVLITASLTPSLTPTAPPILICDVTFNGSISALDASRILQSVAGLRVLDAKQRIAADATGDGTVSALDATRILQWVAGLRPPQVPASRCGLRVPAT